MRSGWTRPAGFLLIEAVVALAVSALAVGCIWQGLAISIAAEERRHFYARSAEFLQTALHPLVEQSPGTAREQLGTVEGEGTPVRYRIVSEPEPAVPGLTRVTVVLTQEASHGPPLSATVSTYVGRALRFPQREEER